MVCQLETPPAESSTPNKSQARSQLLSSLSLTILTSTPAAHNNNTRRTSSTIVNNNDSLDDRHSSVDTSQHFIFKKNSVSLNNLEQQLEYGDGDSSTVVLNEYRNNNSSSNNTTNERTLVQSIPDLDSFVLNKCYRRKKKNDFRRSNLSLSNKINGDESTEHDDEEEEEEDEDDDFDDDDDLVDKPAVISSASSSETSTSPVVSTSKQSCSSASCLSTSPSISISLSQQEAAVHHNTSSQSDISNTMLPPPPVITNKHRLSTTSSIMPLNPNYLAAEIASISSLTSNYSQFDFLQNSEQQAQQLQQDCGEKKSSTFSSFFNRFTSLNGNKSKSYDLSTAAVATNSGSIFGGAFKLFQSSANSSAASAAASNVDGKVVVKSSSDYSVPSSVLILENRPSNLPAKPNEEALKHMKEYEKMVEIAKKKEQKEKEMKMKKTEQQTKKEDFMANSLKIWNTEILTNWCELKSDKRTQKLWWHGLPPSIRGKVWKLAIGNELNLGDEQYHMYVKKAQEKIEILSRRSSDYQLDESSTHESSVELIKLDVSRTFPQLCFFQRDGPYHDALHNVLGAYACYNPKIGYVQGMSFLAAILLLNMESSDAFVCLSNLLNNNYLIACFCMDQYKMNCYFKIHEILFERNIPKLFHHFEKQKVKPDLYLIEWIFTLFSKSLPLDVVSRVWDVYLRDKEEFLFRTALGILNMYKDVLLEMDFENIVNFLTKLPEDMNSTHLFKSIENMKTYLDNDNIQFDDLIAAIVG